jgi:cytoskeletal protein CcmA (bactofilin family)
MAPAKAVLKFEPTSEVPQRISNALAGTELRATPVAPVSSNASGTVPIAPVARSRRDNQSSNFQARIPVITGEASFRGLMPVDGIISGHLGAAGSTLTLRQRPHSSAVASGPELTGEISFKDMLRVNGHIACTVTSQKGTLIVDGSAQVDGDIDVGVLMISGRVNGDVIAQERVELGPAAVITGNISTRSLTMKPGAFFQGDCRMLKNENNEK